MASRSAYLLSLGLAAAMAWPAAAQESTSEPGVIEIKVDVAPPMTRKLVAIPEARLAGTDPVLAPAAKELHQVLSDDLRYSGVFQLVDPKLYRLVLTPTTPDNVPFEEWESLSAEWLVLLGVNADKGEFVVDARLYALGQDRKLVLGKRYRSRFDAARRVAHTISDEFVRQVSGKAGVARTRLAFISDRVGSREIYLADYDGHDPRRITTNRALNIMPSWSPDDAAIVYTSYLAGNPDIYAMTAHGGTPKALVSRRGLSYAPVYSPDGRRIAYASSGEGDVEVYVMNADGSGAKRLTHAVGIDTSPTWSPNGGEIAFTSSRSGTPQIWIMDSDGLNLRQLTRHARYNDLAAWSPDGARIAFCSGGGANFDIQLYEISSGEFRQLTRGEGSNERPTWSPDGRQIAFMSNREGRKQIFVMNDDGSNVRRVIQGGNNLMPAWSRGWEK